MRESNCADGFGFLPGYGGDLREIKDRFLDSLELENCRYEKYEDK